MTRGTKTRIDDAFDDSGARTYGDGDVAKTSMATWEVMLVGLS